MPVGQSTPKLPVEAKRQASLASNQVGIPTLDTTAGSVPHRLAEWRRSRSRATIYATSIALTYVPLLFAAALSPLPLWTDNGGATLPFLRDWNIAYAFLISFPMLVVLLVSDQTVLSTSIREVRTGGFLDIPEPVLVKKLGDWHAKFFKVNITAQIVGVVAGIALGYLTFRSYLVATAGGWIGSIGHVLPAGYVYLYCISLLYALIIFYVARCIAASRFLNDLVGNAAIRMLPFHPDGCGGLRAVGRLGLRNQYTVTILGLNVVILAIATPAEFVLIAWAAVAYLVLGPVVFLGPLLPFRSGMTRAKTELTGEVTQRLQIEFDRVRSQIQSSSISKEDDESIERLRKIAAVIDELPVWPFDARTLRRFASAYVVPFGVPLVGYFLKIFAD